MLRTDGPRKSGPTEQRCRVTPGRGNPTESATESKPPVTSQVRVKGWGKSLPGTGNSARMASPTGSNAEGNPAAVIRSGDITAGQLWPLGSGWQLEAREQCRV